MIKDHTHIRLIDLSPGGHRLTPGSNRHKALAIIKRGINSNGVYPIAYYKRACRPALGPGGSDQQAMNALEGLCRHGYTETFNMEVQRRLDSEGQLQFVGKTVSVSKAGVAHFRASPPMRPPAFAMRCRRLRQS